MNFLRVEHYGKGAPPLSTKFVRSRPVPAITGAFISLNRKWFENIGGFSEDYVFGHYEDADLCLKSLEKGVCPWMHDVKLWHLEGKGSHRLPVHEGASIVNRWLFNRRWAKKINTRYAWSIATSWITCEVARVDTCVSQRTAGPTSRTDARSERRRSNEYSREAIVLDHADKVQLWTGVK